MPDKNLCPKCDAALDGDLIYETFLEKYEGDESRALEAAEMYGATKTTGRWSRRISLYDISHDRTTAYRCPDCGHEWPK